MTARSLRVLVVEDEMTIAALLIEDLLTELGHEVVELAMRLPDAMRLAQTAAIDLAILDVNLAGRMSFPVAEALSARRVPFIFATGYGSAGIEDGWKARAPVLKKPFDRKGLAGALERFAA